MSYSTPTAAELQARYPAFTDVADWTIDLWIAEGEEETATWPDTVRARAVMAYAGHRMAEQGLGTASAFGQGVNSFRSGSFAASLSDTAANRTGLSATIYGREFLDLARRYFGGPRLAWVPPADVTS